MSLFVDTSIWYAAADRGDRANAQAKRVLAAGERLVTTDHVLVECVALVAHRLDRSRALRFWEAIRGGAARVELVTGADLESAWAAALAFPDQPFSFVDCTSFAVMQRLGLVRVATLDSDFAVFRFGPGLRRAFTLVN